MSPDAGEATLAGATRGLPRLGHGVSAADLMRVVRRETERILKEADGDHRKALRLARKRAESTGIFSEADLARVRTAFDIAFDVESGQPAKDAVERLEALYGDALVDPSSTPAGLATLDVLSAAAREKPPFGTFTVIGALTGMVIGGETGAVIGAAVGLVVDIVVGSKPE